MDYRCPLGCDRDWCLCDLRCHTALLRYLSCPECSKQYHIIARALQVDPLALECRNGDDNTAIHLAVARRTSPEVISLLMWWAGHRGVDVVSSVNANNETPLHIVMMVGASLSSIRLLLGIDPGAALLKQDNGKQTPLHVAVVNQAPSEIVDLLCLKQKKALQVAAGPNQWTPLHVATERSHEDTVRRMADMYPQGLQTQDAGGRTCLHLAIINRRSLPLIMYLADKCPRAVWALGTDPDHNPGTHLYYAVEAGMPLGAFANIVRVSEGAELVICGDENLLLYAMRRRENKLALFLVDLHHVDRPNMPEFLDGEDVAPDLANLLTTFYGIVRDMGKGPEQVMEKVRACLVAGFTFGAEVVMEAYPVLCQELGADLEGEYAVALYLLARIARNADLGSVMYNVLRGGPNFWLKPY